MADVKLPAFTADMSGVWFNQLEAYLTIKGIADRSLWFLHASFALSPDEKRQVRDLLEINPPPVDAYQQLKEHLQHLYKSDATSRIRECSKYHPWKASGHQSCWPRCAFSAPEATNSLFKEMFYERLPADMQNQLAEATPPP